MIGDRYQLVWWWPEWQGLRFIRQTDSLQFIYRWRLLLGFVEVAAARELTSCWPEEWIGRDEQGEILYCFRPFGIVIFPLKTDADVSEEVFRAGHLAKLEVEIEIGRDIERKLQGGQNEAKRK